MILTIDTDEINLSTLRRMARIMSAEMCNLPDQPVDGNVLVIKKQLSLVQTGLALMIEDPKWLCFTDQ
jgi:hypothetical protein